MSRYGYPPSHRNVLEPQPEVCDLCGTLVGGVHLVAAEVQGLRGFYICDVTPGCRRFRAAMSFDDRRSFNAREHTVIGSSRVFPAGADKQFDTQ